MHITLPMLLHPQVATSSFLSTSTIFIAATSCTTATHYHPSQVDIADVIDAGRIMLVGGKPARLSLCVHYIRHSFTILCPTLYACLRSSALPNTPRTVLQQQQQALPQIKISSQPQSVAPASTCNQQPRSCKMLGLHMQKSQCLLLQRLTATFLTVQAQPELNATISCCLPGSSKSWRSL